MSFFAAWLAHLIPLAALQGAQLTGKKAALGLQHPDGETTRLLTLVAVVGRGLFD